MSSSLMICVAIVVVLVARWIWFSTLTTLSIRGDVLLVFAHPDDEAMFFTPLLHYLRRQGFGVHFLCLCNGGFDGLGNIREEELHKSGAYFGIPARNVKVVDRPELQDGMQNIWQPEVVRHEIEQYMQEAGNISTIVTFDNGGVSGHPNHIAVHNGVKLTKTTMPPGLIFLQLHTRNIVSKYLGVASLLAYLTVFNPNRSRNDFAVMIPPSRVGRSMRAMQQHASQLVWFRYLFVMFSSYTYINEFEEL